MDDHGQWSKRSNEDREKTYYDHLFGSTDERGAVTFFDAWWWPTSENAVIPIHQDVMTVHHQDYYQGKSECPPSDVDDPVPVAFASVTGSYLVGVEGDPGWCDVALRLLKLGLSELGIGAKTNAGYGRVRLEYEAATRQSMTPAERLADRLRETISRGADAQRQWVLSNYQKPQPEETSEANRRELLRDVFEKVIEDLRADINRDEHPDVAKAKAALDQFNREERPPPDDNAAQRRRKKRKAGLEENLKNKKKRNETYAAQQERARRFLDWLESSS